MNLGIPDCLLAFPHGVFVMVELKVVKRGRKVNLSPHQVAFHIKHADLNCPTYILVQYHPAGTTHASKSELLLFCGEQAIDLVNRYDPVKPRDGGEANEAERGETASFAWVVGDAANCVITVAAFDEDFTVLKLKSEALARVAATVAHRIASRRIARSRAYLGRDALADDGVTER